MKQDSDKAADLEDGLLDEVKKGLFNIRHRSREEAFQEALDETTPEKPGDPRDKLDTHRKPEPEWL